MQDASAVTTILFTDIEGSTRLWEQQPQKMRAALAEHDALTRSAVERHRGTLIKTTGDGACAAFDEGVDAVAAAVELQQSLSAGAACQGVALRVRCGLHAGIAERRDNDLFGSAVNRAARVMSAAHGGQIIVSQAVADTVRGRLPRELDLRDLGSVRLRDLARPERVYQVLHPVMRADFPALRSLEATPNNLPQQVTPLIGRERALAEVRSLLQHHRMVTVTGMGGLGKTRVCLQVAADVMDDYGDGVWFVELAPLSDPRLVVQAVARALGAAPEADRPVHDVLRQLVRDRTLLIVLDNCEHLAQACAAIAKDLLQAGPGVKVLASSREALRLAGEAAYALAPLAVPDAAASAPDLLHNEAVRLFHDRAVAVDPAFRVDNRNAGAVAEICRRVEGIPLALELAAARVRALSVGQIAARLSDRFRLLTRGDTTALPRQQTLRACLDWSHDLLSDEERIVFRRLAVFSGGWSLEAAEAVCAGDGIGQDDVLELLTRLVERSLVTTQADGARYDALETVRQYMQDRLRESPEADRVRSRHLAFQVALTEGAIAELIGPKPGAALARLDPDQQNILAAYAWPGHDAHDAELALRLTRSVIHIWTHRGPHALGYHLITETLARPQAQIRGDARCRALAAASQFAVLLGHFEDAQAFAGESLSIARELGDKGRIAIALQLLGMACSERGDRAAAQRHFEESIVLARETGPRRRLAASVQNLAKWHRDGGNDSAAQPLLEEALALAREEGDRGANTAASLCSLADVMQKRGDCERARTMLQEATSIAEEIGSVWVEYQVLDAAALLAARMGDWPRAARYFGAAERVLARTGMRRDLPLAPDVRNALEAAATAAALPSHEATMADARAWLDVPLTGSGTDPGCPLRSAGSGSTAA